MILAALAIMAATTPPPERAPVLDMRRTVTPRGEAVRLSDLYDLAPLEPRLRARVANLVIVRGRPGEGDRRYDARALQSRASALAPGLRSWLDGKASGLVLVRRSVRPEPAKLAEACLRVTVPLAVGDVVAGDRFEPAKCDGRQNGRALGYDRRLRAVTAFRSLAVGDVIAAPPSSLLADVSPGTTAALRVQVGPVLVERQVTLLQAGYAGRPVFARTSDGKILTLPLKVTGE